MGIAQEPEGAFVGEDVGTEVGLLVGELLGLEVGEVDGALVGVEVGADVGSPLPHLAYHGMSPGGTQGGQCTNALRLCCENTHVCCKVHPDGRREGSRLPTVCRYSICNEQGTRFRSAGIRGHQRITPLQDRPPFRK